MTAILVILTLAAFLGADYLVSRRRQPRGATMPALPELRLAPELFRQQGGLFYGNGHTWARLEADGSMRVGIDDFTRALLGGVDRIETAPAGAALGRRDAAFVLHRGDKSLGFALPVEGRITAVNAGVQAKPESLGEGEGAWLVSVEPRRLARDLRRLRVAEDARAWLREETARLRGFLAAQMPPDAVGATLHDGGVPVEGVLAQLDAAAWEKFEAEFLVS